MIQVTKILVALIYFVLCIAARNQTDLPISALVISPFLIVLLFVFAKKVFPTPGKTFLPYVLVYLFSILIASCAICTSSKTSELSSAALYTSIIASALGFIVMIWFNKQSKGESKHLVINHAVYFWIGLGLVGFFSNN